MATIFFNINRKSDKIISAITYYIYEIVNAIRFSKIVIFYFRTIFTACSKVIIFSKFIIIYILRDKLNTRLKSRKQFFLIF